MHIERFHEIGSVVGTLVSALFLFAIALANLAILRPIWRAIRGIRSGRHHPSAELEPLLANPGVLTRIVRPVFRLIGRSWHMYPLGFLFGLGFDTATEVSLLGISASQAAKGLEIWSIMVFPALFAAGMSLVDTADAVLMLGAYNWAFVSPLRKLYYNLTITSMSVAVAFVIGGIELLGLTASRFDLSGGVWRAIAVLNDNVNALGFSIIGLFAAAWAVSVFSRYVRPSDIETGRRE
jgi:high-affinity nickel-transport protein